MLLITTPCGGSWERQAAAAPTSATKMPPITVTMGTTQAITGQEVPNVVVEVTVGETVGIIVGEDVGTAVGETVGAKVGTIVGEEVGERVGG